MTWLHRSAVLLAACTVALVLLGALVTSTGSGLSIDAWPSPFSTAAVAPAGAAIQQAHRLVAALVGLLTLIVAAGVWRTDSRAWMKGLAVGALAMVVAQGVYGGIGVLNGLPAYISVFHATLAQVFLAITIAVALFTSPGWLAEPGSGATPDRPLRRWTVWATAAIFLQIVIGASMRHSYAADGRPAGLAIPDYPLAFGQLLPMAQLGSWSTAIDFLHRVVALATAVLVAVVAARVFRRHLSENELVRPAALLALVVLAQVALGGLTVLSGGHPAVSTTHAATVTAALGASLVLALRAYRPGFALRGGAASPAAGGATETKGVKE